MKLRLFFHVSLSSFSFFLCFPRCKVWSLSAPLLCNLCRIYPLMDIEAGFLILNLKKKK
jgi:hypothetical protein